MDDGSFTDAAVAPLDGSGSGGVAPSGPGQSLLAKLLPQLLPALITGTGLALTSPIKSGPLIAGRALLGGLEGWQQATPTQKDLYYQERMQREHGRWAQVQEHAQSIADPNEKEYYLSNPAGAMKDYHELAAPEARAHLESIGGAPMAATAKLSHKDVFEADQAVVKSGKETMLVNYRTGMDGVPDDSQPVRPVLLTKDTRRPVWVGGAGANQGKTADSPRPISGTILVNRYTGEPLAPNDDPSTGVPMSVLRDPKTGAVTGMTGIAPAAKDMPTVSDKPNVHWINDAGKLATNDDPTMSIPDAKKQRYFAVAPKVVEKLDQGQQALTMLTNMSQVVDELKDQGKMLDKTGAAALAERLNLAWQRYTGDNALNVMAANSSEMIAIQRALGDKMRAIQAFQGATDIIKEGRAQYPAVKQYLQQLDTAIRAGKPGQTPKAWEDVAGAREMGKGKSAAPTAAPTAVGPTASSGADVLRALGLPPRPGGAAAPSSPAAAPPAVAASPDGTRFVQNPATGEVHPLAPGFEVPPGWKQVQ